MKDLSIIIVNWNTRDLLRQCLRSIIDTSGSLEVEIIVIDNGSTDSSSAMVQKEFPSAQLITNTANLGFARANNQGIRASQGRQILLLNSDTVVHAGALAALIGFLDTHSQVGIVGPELLNSNGTIQPSWAQFPTLWSEIRGVNLRGRQPFQSHDSSPAYSVDWVGGACLMIRRTAVEQAGLLDERFFMYSEETDWCFRVRELGWCICYYPRAHVTHLGGQSSRMESNRMKAELYRSKLRFFAKHRSTLALWSLGVLLQALFLGRALWGWLLYRGTMKHWNRASLIHQDSLEVFRTLRVQLRSGRV